MTFLDTNQQVDTPVGGEFSPSGFVAPWNAAIVYRLYAQLPMPDDLTNREIISVQRGSGYWYYSEDEEAMNDLQHALGIEIGAQQVWHFETKVDDVINLQPDVRDKFGEVLSYDLNIRSLFANKYRHEYHMIALPAAVRAYAEMLGYDVPEEPNLPELTDMNSVFSDQLQWELIGHPDHKSEDDEFHYTKSKLWQRRTELWAVLGESNPKAYRPMNSGTNFDTTSEKLNNALNIANTKWVRPAWIKMVTVNDPRYDATYNDNRLKLPVIWKIYNDQVEAANDNSSNTTTTNVPAQQNAPVSTSTDTPALPEAWAGMENEWKDYLKTFKVSNPTLNPPVIAKAQSELSATKEDITNWWNLV